MRKLGQTQYMVCFCHDTCSLKICSNYRPEHIETTYTWWPLAQQLWPAAPKCDADIVSNASTGAARGQRTLHSMAGKSPDICLLVGEDEDESDSPDTNVASDQPDDSGSGSAVDIEPAGTPDGDVEDNDEDSAPVSRPSPLQNISI
jgi:hypothetical protein